MFLLDTYKSKNINIVSADEFLPFPKPDDRQAWEKIDSDLKNYIIEVAEKASERRWNDNTAMDYINYFKKGTLYDNHSERNSLLHLICAECIENKGRFIEPIVNGVWSMCEKTDWIPPQHLNHMYDTQKNFLPDIEEQYRFIDLHIGMTASVLAWAYYFHKEKLDEITPLICKRIKYEVKRKLFDTYLVRKDFGWMGFVPSRHKVNNWNPFIISHCIECAMILEEDSEKRRELFETSLLLLDNYYNIVPEDGGCDEGPHYWSLAGGAVFDCLEIMHYATNGEYDLFNTEKIRKMGQYMNKVHIHKNYFVNFADTRGKTDIPMLLYRYGQKIGDNDVAMLGLTSPYQHGSSCKFRIFADLLSSDERFSPDNPVNHTVSSWLEDTEIGVARENKNTHEGLFLAFKGGHNDESHNHNDVGHFIVYSDGMPGIIDVGVGTYIPITFSERRYELYNMQSAFHNLPTVNGYMQQAGRQYVSENMTFTDGKDAVSASLSIKNAYPSDSGIEHWNRSYKLDRINSNITITDDFSLASETDDITWTLMTPVKPEISDSRIKLPVKDGKALIVNFPDYLTAKFEQLPLDAVSDGLIKKSWGELYRILLKLNKPCKSDNIKIEIIQEK